MSGREMVVGAGHMHGGRNYDELIEMSGEPQHHGHHPQHHGGHPQHVAHAPQHHGHHPQHHGGHMVPAQVAYVPAGQYVQPASGPAMGYAPPPPQQQHHDPHHEPRGGGAPRRRIIEEEPTHERLFPIGFVQLAIAPGDEVDIEVKPQVYFRGERLAIPQTIARYFDIVDIKIGKDSQLAATGAMPGESFSTVAVGVRMELSTAKPGIVITLRVKNVDTGDQDFKAVMYGAVME
ncbi:MAG: hypothetical protein ACHREM_01450 [Polyangiales bacterium]